MPVPSGIFIPVFKIGAALGRAVGEAMALWFPTGVRYGGIITPIIPGNLIKHAIIYYICIYLFFLLHKKENRSHTYTYSEYNMK